MPTTLLMNHLIDVNKKLAKYVSSSDYDGFLSTFLTLQPGTHSSIICLNNGALFRLAASTSHPSFIEKMISLVPHHFEALVKAQDFAAFREAASHDQHETLIYFSRLLPDATPYMIKARHYEAFRDAAAKGHLKTAKTLVTMGRDQLSSMIQARGFFAFNHAIANGHFEMAQYLLSIADDTSFEMISFKHYEVFRLAAKNGHLKILKWLIHEFNVHTPLMISACHYGALSLAAQQGHIEVVEFLLSRMSLSERQFALSLPAQFACRYAAEKGHLTILTILLKSTEQHLPELIINHFPACYLLAAKNEHLEILSLLQQLAPGYLQEMLEYQRCEAINDAIIHRKLNLIRFFNKNAHSILFDLLDEETYDTFYTQVNGTELYMGDDLFISNIEAGALDAVVEHLDWLNKHSQQEQLALDEQYTFNLAAQHGHVDILSQLIEYYPYSPYDIITEDDNALLHTAVKYQQQAILKMLFSLIDPEDVRELIQEHEYALIATACQTGNWEIVHHLCDLSGDAIETILDRSEHRLFKIAIEHGHFHVLQNIILQATEAWNDFWQSHLIDSMLLTAKNGHISILQYLVDQARSTTAFIKKILDNNQSYLKELIKQGHIETLSYLATMITPEHNAIFYQNDTKYTLLSAAVESGNIDMFDYVSDKFCDELIAPTDREIIVNLFELAIKHDHINLAWHLIENIPQHRKALLQYHEYELFRYAIKKNNLSLVENIINYSPENLQFMLFAKNSEAIKHLINSPETPLLAYLISMAPQAFGIHVLNDAQRIFLNIKKHGTLLKQMLYIPDIFFMIFERNDELNSLEPFIQKIVADTTIGAINHHNAYLVQHTIAWCIEKNTKASASYAIELLSHPLIKRIANEPLNHFDEKNLLEIAIKYKNMSVARVLYRIPAVQRFANSDEFNQRDTQQVSIRRLSMDQESSITSLRSTERKRLDICLNSYRIKIESVSRDHMLARLKDDLTEYYRHNPAQYRDKQGRVHSLPLTWEQFTALGLTQENRLAALKAYHAHREHTVLRFLSKPNRWLAHDAEYVKQDVHDPSHRWAYFEEYEETIALLYLAATDEHVGLHDGFDHLSRKEEFYNELALIARAHNWDTQNHHEMEALEYDDYSEGDKPSCYSGILRRLFQSVKGHPTLTPIGKPQIDQEIREFVNTKLIANIPYRCIYRVKEELDKIFSLESADIKFLKSFDITDEEISHFIERLKTKYHLEDWNLILYTDFRLTVNKEDCHLSVFYSECNLEQFFRAHRRNARMTPMYGHEHISSSLSDQTNESHRKRVRFK